MDCISKDKLPFTTLAFLDNHANFQKSGVPSRVLFFVSKTPSSSQWTDFPSETLEIFRKGFTSKLGVVPVAIFGRDCIADFIRMVLIDPKVGCVRSIAWIDSENKCFFPKKAAECNCWKKKSAESARFIPEIPDLNL